ncbi:GTP-binding nuclear protein GSP1/Ran [Dictyocoela muelleri]|nr:GTP-binding nuclear protein GSP1/Ran [Dictyocoela muelleri]
MAFSEPLKFKIVILGDGATGKTTYVKRVKDGYFVRGYKATQGADVNHVQLYLKDGRSVIYEIWDTAGQENRGGLSEIYYLNASAGIIMYNVTSRSTFTHVQKWLSNLREITNSGGYQIPVVVVGNMIDLADKKVKHEQVISEISNKVYKTVEMSIKIEYNIDKPLLYLTRALLNDMNIKFVGKTELEASTASMKVEMKNSENILKARSMNLPDEEFN